MAAAEPVVIAALGDSLTQGYGLLPDQGLVPQLEHWLTAQGQDVRLINSGVSGDTTAGGLARVGWTLTPDVQAMIVALGGNDILRGLAPEEARKNIAGILKAGRDAGVAILLVGLEAPLNYGPDYKAAFDAIYPELAAEYATLLMPSMFSVFDASDRPLADFLQADMLHPNPEGVAMIVAGMGPKVLEMLEQITPQ